MWVASVCLVAHHPPAPPCRGAHTFFLREKEVPRWGGYTVNLIHYEDAAALCLAVLRGAGAEDGQQYKGRTFLGCDGAPITFEVSCFFLGGMPILFFCGLPFSVVGRAADS